MKNLFEFKKFVETNLDPNLFIDNKDGGWYQIGCTPFYLGYAYGNIVWYDHRIKTYTDFETVLEESPEAIQEKLVFYLDLFR